jgi:hypothetical protein
MKTFKEKLMAVLIALGWAEKAKASALTKEDMDKVVASYNETHSSDFYADMKADQEQAQKAAALDAAMAVLAEMTPEEKSEGETTEKTETPEKEGKTVDLAQAIKDLATKNASLEKGNKDLSEKVEKLSMTLENDNPKKGTVKVEGFAMTHTDKHAFGIEHAMFSMDKRWNKIAVNAAIAQISRPTTADEISFKAEVNTFGESLKARFAFLHQNNLLDPQKLSSTSIDLTVVGSDMGNQFVIRRQDNLISQILLVKNVNDIFPRRYGIQDQELIINALFTEVSQGWQAGKVFKGSAAIEPERGHVDDASIKLQFAPLVDLERNYLGYLNTEGSGDIKLGMIEWYTLNILLKAVQEQTKRRVLGCAVKPETAAAGLAINASTGFIFTLIRYMHQYKLLPMTSASLATYDSTTMFDTVKAYLDAVVAVLGDQILSDFTLILNANHKTWWLANVRTKFGLMTDFTGPKSNVVPDYDIPIYWMPAMEKLTFMTLLKPGNVQQLENLPGEMLALEFTQDFEDILVRSRWKEGMSAAFVGKKFSTAAALLANNYEYQQIFTNKPALAIVDDSVTLNAALNFWFLTTNNTTAGKKITDITNAKAGQVYIIECGGITQPQTIDKAAKFANLTAAWTPTAVGDYLMVILDNAGTAFRELERCVAGVRTVNALVQPTLPEART